MPLTLSLQFPAGRYVAASWGNRDEVEWPPHPARLCLALIDVLHKSGNADQNREALRWLFRQPPPTIVIPAHHLADEQLLDGIFVPQNPSAYKPRAQTLKQRSFPAVFLDSDRPTVFFHWPDSDISTELRESLTSLVSSLPRLGHSSSLVMASVSEDNLPSGDGWRLIQPLDSDRPGSPEFRLRVNWDGLLESAEAAFDAEGREKEMAKLIDRAVSTAKPDKALKPAASPRGRHDPRHRWQGYAEESKNPPVGTPWDRRILVLAQTGGDRMGLPSTWQITQVFHKSLLDRWGRNPALGPIPSWISGHQEAEAGQKSGPADACHLAIFPLAFVGATHATGHLLGLGIAVPRPEDIGVDPATFRIQWRQALSALLGAEGELELCPPDKAWSLRLKPDESPDPKKALLPSRWTRPATTWSSITPIILERHPKPHFAKDPIAWRNSCEAIIGDSCLRLGLPKPERVEVSPHSPISGVSPAFAFAAPAARSGRPPRFHVHASLQFAEPIEGPLLLGAGRYRGYGLCLPLDNTKNDENLS
jgi:CRISPR-associated protein Csb2